MFFTFGIQAMKRNTVSPQVTSYPITGIFELHFCTRLGPCTLFFVGNKTNSLNWKFRKIPTLFRQTLKALSLLNFNSQTENNKKSNTLQIL